mmetsp:Transcript_6560/g.13322  ORF Transcript_6560/g.13322 Transcript_6560/m.13322 type:complete len:246 (-) Transcript_6560:1168-1905(-)
MTRHLETGRVLMLQQLSPSLKHHLARHSPLALHSPTTRQASIRHSSSDGVSSPLQQTKPSAAFSTDPRAWSHTRNPRSERVPSYHMDHTCLHFRSRRPRTRHTCTRHRSPSATTPPGSKPPFAWQPPRSSASRPGRHGRLVGSAGAATRLPQLRLRRGAVQAGGRQLAEAREEAGGERGAGPRNRVMVSSTRTRVGRWPYRWGQGACAWVRCSAGPAQGSPLLSLLSLAAQVGVMSRGRRWLRPP